MRELLTDLLDLLGLLLLAAGAAAGLFSLIGWVALAPAGAVLLAGSAFAQWQARPADRAPE